MAKTIFHSVPVCLLVHFFVAMASASEPAQKDGPGSNLISQKDGVILFIGTDIQGEKAPTDQLITIRERGKEKTYRQLNAGDVVEKGQLVGRLDDRMPRMELAFKEHMVKIAEREQKDAERELDECQQRFLTELIIFRVGAARWEDLKAALKLVAKAEKELQIKREAFSKKNTEFKDADALMEKFEIHSPKRGVIQSIGKRPGEVIRKGEPIIFFQTGEAKTSLMVELPSLKDGLILFIGMR